MKFNQFSANILSLAILVSVLSGHLYPQYKINILKKQLNTAENTNRIDILNELAYEYRENHDSISFYNQLALKSAENLNYTKGTGEAKSLLGYSYFLIKDYKKAEDIINSAISILKNEDSPLIMGMNYYYLGDIYSRANDKDRATAEYLKALEYLKKANALKEQSIVHTSLARLDWIRSNYDSYIKHNKASLELCKKINYKKGMAANLNNLGAVHFQKAYYGTSIRYYFESLKLREELKDSSKIAMVLNNIGLSYQQLGDVKNAVKYIKRALSISTRIKDSFTTGYTFNCLGKVYEGHNDLDSALIFFTRSLSSYERGNDQSGVAFSSTDIGRTYNSLHKPSEALKQFRNSLGYYQSIGNNKKLAEIYKNIGISHALLNNFNKALHYFNKSQAISREIGQRSTLKDVFEQLSLLYRRKGDYKKSLDYNLLLSEMKDSLANDKYHRSIAEVQASYEIEKKNLELLNKEYELERQNMILMISIVVIILLLIMIVVIYRYSQIKSKNNRELKKAYDELNRKTEELNTAVNTKDKFFSIIAHDLKNPFHNLLGVSEILHKDQNSLSTEEKDSLIYSIFQSSRDIYSLLENLLTWSMTQRKLMMLSNEKIALRELINNCISTINPSAVSKNLSICNEADNFEIEGDSNALSTVINNLLMNAVKFSHPDKRIRISTEFKDEYVYLSIEDQGTGMSQDVISKLFRLNSDVSTKGTNNESGTGLGLIICKELIELMNGKITVQSEVNKGTRFTIELSIKKTSRV